MARGEGFDLKFVGPDFMGICWQRGECASSDQLLWGTQMMRKTANPNEPELAAEGQAGRHGQGRGAAGSAWEMSSLPGPSAL